MGEQLGLLVKWLLGSIGSVVAYFSAIGKRRDDRNVLFGPLTASTQGMIGFALRCAANVDNWMFIGKLQSERAAWWEQVLAKKSSLSLSAWSELRNLNDQLTELPLQMQRWRRADAREQEQIGATISVISGRIEKTGDRLQFDPELLAK